MRQLNKIEIFIYALGGLMMAIGTCLFTFFIKQDIACIVMLIGAIGFSTMQMRQQYLGTDLTIRRLRKIMLIADFGFILAGLFMVEDIYGIIRPFFVNSISGYTTYVNIFYHNCNRALHDSSNRPFNQERKPNINLKKSLKTRQLF